MLVTQLITHALIKAKISKKRIIIVLFIIYGFCLLVLTNAFDRIHHNRWITLGDFLLMGGLMALEMKYLIKFITSETEKK